jgi:CheY-like chemotaxis protein
MAGDDARKVHAILRRQTDHLTRLVDDLLDVARLVRGKVTLHRSRVNLNRVLRQALDCTQDAAENKRHALAVTERGAVWVDGDETRLLQIVVNIVDNAIKYTPPGGHIAMRLGREEDSAVLTVQDDGPGIAPDLLPHVFDLFTQGERPLDRAQGGLGLGLNIARRLAELHGGSIEAHSVPGRGARFTVRLPLAAAPATAAGPPSTGSTAGRAKKVLIVEDNADVREMLQTSLELGGHVVRTAHDGPSALAVCEDWTPDVALLDIGLPGMDGYELAHALRRTKFCSEVMLVAVTGYAASSDRARAKAAGFDAHVSKPVDPQVLQSVLDGGQPPPRRMH